MNIEKIITTAIIALGIAGSAALAMGGTRGPSNDTIAVHVAADPADGIHTQNFAPDANHLLGI
jgi:hypothetical protein